MAKPVALAPLMRFIEWIRETYRAPFQPPRTFGSLDELERTRRANLLRIIIVTLTIALIISAAPAAILTTDDWRPIVWIGSFVVIGLICLRLNAVGRHTLAASIYIYSFMCAVYADTYSVASVVGVGFIVAALSFIAVALIIGGLTLPESVIWINGAVASIASWALMIVIFGRSAWLSGALSSAVNYLVFSYIAITTLAWLAARSGRAGVMQLADAFEQERQLVLLKDLFIVSANHELRTPIMTLSSNLELMARTMDMVDANERQQMLQRAQRASQDLRTILSNVLDAGIDEKDISHRLRLESLSVRTVVQQALETFDPRELGESWIEQATLKARSVSLHIAPNLMIYADSARVRQILVNLLSNALKYSASGTPLEITANALQPGSGGKADQRNMLGRPRVPSGRWVEICVRDWGSGIPPNERGLLFQRFVRLPRDVASATRGTGVGLYLCRILARAMGGTIWVESTGVPGEGSAFVFALPEAEDQTPYNIDPQIDSTDAIPTGIMP